MELDALIAARHKGMAGFLDERQRRLHAAVETKALGQGGVKRVSEATGVARGSILAGIKELDRPESVAAGGPRRVRRVGGGRKSVAEWTPVFGKRWTVWWNRKRGAIRCHRCDGRVRASCNWRAN